MASTKRNEFDDVSDEIGCGKLAADSSVKGKMIIAASLLIPFGTVAFFVLFCPNMGGAYALDSSVAIGGLQRIALIV